MSNTRHLANQAVNIIISATTSANDYTTADALAADIDLIVAHLEHSEMDDITRARASRTLRALTNGQRRY